MGDTAVRTCAVLSVAMVGLWLGVARAESQTTRATEMGPAVFGGTGTRADKPGGLDLYAQLFTSYDDAVLADQSGGDPPAQGSPAPQMGSIQGSRSGFSMFGQAGVLTFWLGQAAPLTTIRTSMT